MTLFFNIGELLSLRKAYKKSGRKIEENDLDIIADACLLVKKGKIIWLGTQNEFKKSGLKYSKKIDLKGKTVLPSFLECHTHSLFAGDRADEFERRQKGATYQQIAESGGGIKSTMKKTRLASEKKLILETEQKIQNFIKQGVSVLEIKTGIIQSRCNVFWPFAV